MSIPYSWYIKQYRPDNVDDSGQGSAPMAEDYWNKLTNDQQAQIVQSNTMGMDNQTDPALMGRYNAAMGQQGDQSRGLTLVQPDWKPNMFNDTSRIFTDPETGQRWTNAENMSPHSQDNDGRFGSRPWLTGIATVLGAGYLGGAFGNVGPLAGSLGEGAGLGTEGGWAGLGETGGLSPEEALIGDPYGGMGPGALGEGGGLDPETWAANGPGGPNELGSSPFGTEFNTIDPLKPSTVGSLPASPPGFNLPPGFSITDPSTWAGALAANPMAALGLLQAGSGLLGGGSKPNGSGSPGGDNGPGKGGSGAPTGLLTRTPFVSNPFTDQQIQNYKPVIPRGYGG